MSAIIRTPDERYGLTEPEAIARREQGLGNNVTVTTGRTYLDILRHNVFTFINTVLFIIGFIMVLLGLPEDALVSVGIVLSNVVVSVAQEFRAKRKLDEIALLTRPKVTVLRAGQERVVDPAEIVLGDILIARSGDQIVVDGVVVGQNKMEVDESLLTGESDLVPKKAGDRVYSGSFCVTGSATYETTEVGAASFANKLTARAKTYRLVLTPMQQDINFVVRILAFLASVVGILFAVSFVAHEAGGKEGIRAAAVIAGLVPAGLILMSATAYAMGALRMAGKGALIQRANAVESMSNIDVLCLDKTGTLTANRIHLHALHPLTVTEAELKAILGDYAHNVRSGTRTSDALLETCAGQSRQALDEIPFSSARKWSALALNDPERNGVYVFGAPEMLEPYLPRDADIGQHQIEIWAERGRRVLLLAYSPHIISLHDAQGRPFLPGNLQPLGLASFSDELRPEVQTTIAQFTEAGITLKIISGDNPQTVAALARQAGFPPDIQAVSGADLENMDEAQLAQVAEAATVFGRITPEQKETLITHLRQQGHYVGMIGDGVNDVLSLKQAQIGIAMQSGSAATRGVADIVLLDDSFAALPAAFMEGQRILNGMEDIIRLFLARAFYAAFIILGTAVVAQSEFFPFVPKHNSLLTFITVGIPAFALAAWARPGLPKHNLAKSIVHFILPAALTLAGAALTIYALYLWRYWYPAPEGSAEALAGIDRARTALTTSVIFMGLLLVVFVEPPVRFLTGGDELSADWRPTILALLLLITYLLLIVITPLRKFFELAPLGGLDFLLIAAISIAWAALQCQIWRNSIFERFLGINRN